MMRDIFTGIRSILNKNSFSHTKTNILPSTSVCPYCKEQMDGMLGTHDRIVSPGRSISICLSCGEIGLFGRHKKLEKIHPTTLHLLLEQNDPDLMRRVYNTQKEIQSLAKK